MGGGKITIQEGTIRAEGGDGAAGIGSGYYLLNPPPSGYGGIIDISGGQITANCDSQGAGIGGGYNQSAGDISITGGTITATGHDYSEQYFLLVENLDLSALQWIPIGHAPNRTKGFDGIFDGNGKQISGMLIGTASDPVASSRLSQVGLFGNLKENARIKDLTVQGEIYAKDVGYVGMLAGYSESSVTPWTFTNCSAEGTIVSTGSGNLRIGGLVGYSTQSNYEDCYSAVDITAYEPLAVGGIGGHIGPGASARLSVVERSTFAGKIEVTGNLIKSGSRAVGGVGGIAGNSVYNAIVNCASEGSVSGAFGSFGGIAGKHHDGAILNSYSIGSMASSDKTANTFVGGIVGLAIEVGVQNVYHAGQIETGGDINNAPIGTIAGYSEQSHVYPPVGGVSSVVSIKTADPYLFHVPAMLNGHKQYLFDLTADEMKGGWVNPIDHPFFEYPEGELIHGDYALLVLLNKWLDLNATEYPEFHFGRWAVSGDKNQGYPYLLPAARRITNGTSAQLFSPEGRLTRGQTVVLLMNAYGIPVEEGAADNFADAGDAYYTDYLATAWRMRLVNGVGDNLFAPAGSDVAV